MLRNVWTAALILFFFLMMSTFFIVNVAQASVMISLVGICWAVACWVPFAMIMEFLKELEADSSRPTPPASRTGAPHSNSLGDSWHSQPSSPSRVRDSERGPLMMRSYSTADLEGASVEYIGQGPVAGGTIMGIHNLAIVLPQFIIAIVASIIFKLADGGKDVTDAAGFMGDSDDPGGPGAPHYVDRTGVAWVLRFGGLMALVGAAICRRVPPTKTEKVMRRRLAEMREEAGE
jgi:solute carrier family 45 protein 1/2/4